jgi:hypothetical protein
MSRISGSTQEGVSVALSSKFTIPGVRLKPAAQRAGRLHAQHQAGMLTRWYAGLHGPQRQHSPGRAGARVRATSAPFQGLPAELACRDEQPNWRRKLRKAVLVQVVQGEPAVWYLLREGRHHYLDINCMYSPVSFSILLQLDATEVTEYEALGRIFLDFLASEVSFRPIRYWSRDLTGTLAERAREAVTNWKGAQQGGPPA